MAKKYIWMDGTEHEVPDPDWNQKEAERLGLIPNQNSGPLPIVGGSDSFYKNLMAKRLFLSQTNGYDLPVLENSR